MTDHEKTLKQALDALEPEGTLTQAAYDRWRTSVRPGALSSQAIANHFGGWCEAVAFCGGTPFTRHRSATAIRDALAAAAAVSGARLTQSSYREWRRSTPSAPSIAAIVNHHGSWVAAVESIGSRPGARSPSQWDKETILEWLRRWDSARSTVGHATRSNYDRWQKSLKPRQGPPASVIPAGEWLAWCEAAGFTGAVKVSSQFSLSDVADALKEAFVDCQPFTARAYRHWAAGRPDRPSIGTVQNHFGSWKDASDYARSALM